MNAEKVRGLWQYVAFEVGGQACSAEQVVCMHPLILTAESDIPGWDGVWGVVTYGYGGGQWPEEKLLSYCRFVVLNSTYPLGAPTSDFYFWAGGKFRLAAPTNYSFCPIDLQQHWRGQDLPSLQLGICRLDGDRLRLCLGAIGSPRPHTFDSGVHPDQSVGTLIRHTLSVT